MNILIIEDNHDKLANLIRVLTSVEGVDEGDICYVLDIHSAKTKLREKHYDLMMLDIAVPNRLGTDIEPDAGIKLLDEIFERDGYVIPANIIGITAYSDIYNIAKVAMDQRLIMIMQYDESSESWEDRLRNRTQQILLSKQCERLDTKNESFLVIVCALENPELSSVKQIPWNWKQIVIPNDSAIIFQGEIKHNEKLFKVYAASATRTGLPYSAILATKLINLFKPIYIGMTGITAGIAGKTKYGDIIIADPSWDWGSGKWVIKDGKLSFSSAPYQISLNPNLRGAIRKFVLEKGLFQKIKSDWPSDAPDHELNIYRGPLASGASVLADGVTAERIKEQHREILGIEMETYSIFAAAEEAASPHPIAFSMKSVVDYADPSKMDSYQKYSAYTSAQAMRHFVEKHLVAEIS
ncbi:MAG TPA: hypothetical protein VGK27_07340 [Candidatus Deferrimicrobiaceae bacterium]|jgi:nucleoside phosphorylase